MKTLLLLAAVSPSTPYHHPDTAQTAKVLIAVLAGLGLFLLGCWIMAKNRRR